MRKNLLLGFCLFSGFKMAGYIRTSEKCVCQSILTKPSVFMGTITSTNTKVRTILVNLLRSFSNSIQEILVNGRDYLPSSFPFKKKIDSR